MENTVDSFPARMANEMEFENPKIDRYGERDHAVAKKVANSNYYKLGGE